MITVFNNDNCAKCGSKNTYYSKKRQLWVCEDCEHELAETPQNPGLRLFFSYGHDANEPIVMRIKSDLEERGHTVWIDKKQIKSGDNWRRSITDGITDSSKVLAFLSRHSTREPGVCLDELRIALCVKGCDIKTILLENEKSVCPPSLISDIQWMDMSSWSEKKAEGTEAFEVWYKDKTDELWQVIESPESRSFQGEIERLRQILQPIILDEKEQILLRKPYVGRTWLNETLEDWRQNKKNAKAFLLFGTPGTGKSAFCVNELFNNPNAICGFLCQWDKPGVSSEKNIMRTLAFKLASKLPDYRKVLLDTLTQILGSDDTKDKRKMSLDDYSPSELFSLLIVNPLRNCIDGSRERQFIVLDGLDEASGASALAQSLAYNLLNLPDWIGFVVTSRPEPEITDVFKNFDPLVIDVTTQENKTDIYSYFEQTLSGLLENAEDRHIILNRATESSEGSFLYAELFADEVLAGRFDLRNHADYPKGLTSFYRQNFQRKFPDYDTYKNIRCFLELMLADEGLPIEILMEIIGCDRYAYREFRDFLGSLLAEKESGDYKHLTFCHKSLADWLADETESGKYFIDKQLGNENLAHYTLERVRIEKAKRDDSIALYLQDHLATYLVDACMWCEYEDVLLHFDMPLHSWYEVDSFPQDWDMTTIFHKIHEFCDVPAKSVQYGRFDACNEWVYIYDFFANAIQTQRLATVFFEALWEPMGRFFESRASEECTSKDYDKVNIANKLCFVALKCIELDITIPKNIAQVIEHVKLSCFFYGVRDEGIDAENQMERSFRYKNAIFSNNICRMENPGKLQDLKTLFNTYCLAYELYTKKDIAKMMALANEGADVDNAKEKALRLVGNDVGLYDKEGKMRKLVGNDARKYYFAQNEISEVLWHVSEKKRWHPMPAEFKQQHYDFDIYVFPCCDKSVVVDDIPPITLPSQFRDDGCEVYEDDEKTDIPESEKDCNHEYEYQDVVKGETTVISVNHDDNMPGYDEFICSASWTRICKKCGQEVKQTGRINERIGRTGYNFGPYYLADS